MVATSFPAINVSGTASATTAVVRWSTSAGQSGVAAGTLNWSAAGIPLRVGGNTVTVRAFDAAGQYSWRSITVVRR